MPAPPTPPSVDTGVTYPYPETVQLTDIDIEIPNIPDIDITPPTILERTIPEITITGFEAQVPNINTDVPIPSRPEYQLPDPPTVTMPNIRAFDGFAIPQFTGEFPQLDLGEITAEYLYTEPVYSSELATRIMSWLENVLVNGGTGLAPEVEQAIWGAAILRLNEEFAAAYDKELKFFASRGFKLPPGALRGALAEVHRAYTRKTAELNKEIMVKQAELAQTNTHFAVEKGIQYEGILREFFNQMANRMMENAKNAVAMAIEIVNAKISVYNARLEAYKTKVTVYEAQIRAMSLLAEAYKVELEAARVNVEIQSLGVQIYKERLQAIGVLATLYESDIKAASLIMEGERNKIELCKGQVEAYSAQVAAEGTRIGLYNALAENDKARANVYAEKMRGYGLMVEGIKTRTDTLIAKANLENEIHNRSALEIYKANIAKIESQVKTHVDLENLKVDVYKADQAGYEAQIKGYEAQTDALVKEYVAKMQYASSQIELILKEAELNQNSTIRLHETKLETLKALAQVMSQLVASALSAINASMNLGYSGGYHLSESWQGNTHVSESHEYREYCDPTCSG